jgi:hypothetical protein
VPGDVDCPIREDPQTNPHPLIVSRLAVAVYGGVQPDKLGPLMRGIDDGLLGRVLWAWPEPLPFRLGRRDPGAVWAIRTLDRLRELDLQPGDPPASVMVPLTREARANIEAFGCRMQDRQATAEGPLRSAFGKARGQALRLALVIEMSWWCGEEGMSPPPTRVSTRAFDAASRLVGDYFMEMAVRVYGNAGGSCLDRDAATLGHWIIGARPTEVHVRHLQRKVRLPGFHTAAQIHSAAERLVALNWLYPPAPSNRFGLRTRLAYLVNPRLWESIYALTCTTAPRQCWRRMAPSFRRSTWKRPRPRWPSHLHPGARRGAARAGISCS